MEACITLLYLDACLVVCYHALLELVWLAWNRSAVTAPSRAAPCSARGLPLLFSLIFWEANRVGGQVGSRQNSEAGAWTAWDSDSQLRLQVWSMQFAKYCYLEANRSVELRMPNGFDWIGGSCRRKRRQYS